MPKHLIRQRPGPQPTTIEEAAQQLRQLFAARFGIEHVDRIFINASFIGADFCDGSSDALIRYREDRRHG
jgi:hypothetical protein